MSEVNSVNNTTSYQRSAEFGSGISGEGVLGLIDRVIAGLQKMGNDMRDVHREFAEQGVGIKYAKMATAMKTKKEAIDLNYNANMANATGKMISGVCSTIGGAGGAFKSQKAGQAFTSGAGGIGKIGEGAMGTLSASYTRQAGKKELLGDYQTTMSEDFNKVLSKAIEEARASSKGVTDLLHDMSQLQTTLFNAVQIGR